NRSRIGKQANGGGQKRSESKAGKHGCGDGHRRPKSGATFDEGAKREGDQHHLKTAVVGEVTDGVFKNIESSTLQSHAVQQNRGENHPANREESESGSISDR